MKYYQCLKCNTPSEPHLWDKGDGNMYCPFCGVRNNYRSFFRLFPIRSMKIEFPKAGSESKAPTTFEDFEQAAAAIKNDPRGRAWKCSRCNHFSSAEAWTNNNYVCPHCGKSRSIAHEVQGTQPQQVQPQMVVAPFQRSELYADTDVQDEEDFEPSERTPMATKDKKYLVGRILIIVGCVIAALLLYSLLNSIGNAPMAANQEGIVSTESLSGVDTPVAPQYEQVVITREVFTGITPVTTPWNSIKTIQLVLYILAMIAAILDRIMSNQWYDAVIAIVAAFLVEFGSAALFNPLAELMTTIPFLNISVIASHWIWALVVIVFCTGAVVWASLFGTRDMTPLALYIGLIAGGSEFFGHLGVLQTLFLIPSGEALSVTSNWQVMKNVWFSMLVYILLLIANYYALTEALKPYGRKSRISVASIVIMALSFVGYLVLRIFFNDVPVLENPIVVVGIVFFVNFLISFFLRERFDSRFGRTTTTAEYKMQQARAMSPFDIILSLCLVGLLLIQFLGKV